LPDVVEVRLRVFPLSPIVQTVPLVINVRLHSRWNVVKLTGVKRTFEKIDPKYRKQTYHYERN